MTAGPRTILITGAGNGIGAAAARQFLDRGWRVGLYDLDGEACERVADGHSRAVTGELDVRDPEAWDRALAQLCPDGALDALSNNAGVLVSGPLAEQTVAQHRLQLDVNVLGVVLGASAGLPYLRRGRDAVLVNTGSASALYGQPDIALYAATKAAVRSLTEALDLEWVDEPVRVRSLMPLWVRTNLIDEAAHARSVGNLGVRLTPEGIGLAMVKLVLREGPGEKIPMRSPHRVVGTQAKLQAAARAVGPDWITRFTVRRLST
ncbi:SDR family oxidoreductase [Rhodococcus aerolatus]